MDRDQALRLLTGGKEGIADWNRRRDEGEAIPDLSKADLSKADLNGANLSGAKLRKTDLRKADLNGANLSGAKLRKANLSRANLDGADFSGANLNMADLSGARLSGANLRNADLSGAYLRKAYLREADLREANLDGANLRGAKLSKADLRGARLSEADLSEWAEFHTHLDGADLGGADLSWADLGGADLTRAELEGANLTGAHFEGADLRNANLSKAVLRGVYLNQADLRAANLSGADLRKDVYRGGIGGNEANLNWADLSGADLSSADLSSADLTGADLTGADLTSANLSQCLCKATMFADVDLSDVLGLESIRHYGPSTVGTDTLFRSQGKIPQAFLAGCGVPEALIAYLPSIIHGMQPIQFYSCFISYSHEDEDFAKWLHARMTQEKLRVWYAPEDIAGGKKVHEQIDQAIRVHDKLLLVLSPASMESEWVKTELRKAFKIERKEGKRKLFPLSLAGYKPIQEWECFDADHGKDLAVEVREYFIPDFSGWKDHDAFEAGFARLLKDFRKADEGWK